MSTGARVAVAAASGYFLGRTKKLKLAIVVSSMLAGRRLVTDSRAMLRQANEFVESKPELARFSGQIRTVLVTAVRSATVGTASQRIDRLSDAIRERSERLTSKPPAATGNEGAVQPASADEASPDSEDEPKEQKGSAKSAQDKAKKRASSRKTVATRRRK